MVEPRALAGESSRAEDSRVRIEDVAAWLQSLEKAVRGGRVYAQNNEMHKRYLDRAFGGLAQLLERLPELSLSVREDRILYDTEVVHLDPDKREGLPFVLYRNTLRRLTFLRGITRDELVAVLAVLSRDHSVYDLAREDLVSALWRLRSPHLRYVAIDTLRVGAGPNSNSILGEAEVDRIQSEIDGIVAAIYPRAPLGEEEIAAAVSINEHDIEAIGILREDDQDDLRRLVHATEKTIAEIAPEQMEAFEKALRCERRDELLRRMVEILVEDLFEQEKGLTSGSTLELLQEMVDTLVLGGLFRDAQSLVQSLWSRAEHAEDIKETHLARQVIQMLAGEARLLPILITLNEGGQQVSISELVDYLRSLGPSVVPALLEAVCHLDSAPHRRLLCGLIVEHGVPGAALLEERALHAKWYVVRDILELASHLPPERVGGLVRFGLGHDHPKVRAQAVRSLKVYGSGLADTFIAERLHDPDAGVRMAAARVAASRDSSELVDSFEKVLDDSRLPARDPEELRILLGAYAKIGGAASVPRLAKLLRPRFFAPRRHTEVQMAAAAALGLVDHEGARELLQRGTRSMSPRLREASRRALAISDRAWSEGGTARARSGESASSLPSVVPLTLSGGPSESRPPAHPALRSGPALPMVDVPEARRDTLPGFERIDGPDTLDLAASHESTASAESGRAPVSTRGPALPEPEAVFSELASDLYLEDPTSGGSRR